MNCLKTNLYIQEVVYTNFLTLSVGMLPGKIYMRFHRKRIQKK